MSTEVHRRKLAHELSAGLVEYIQHRRLNAGDQLETVRALAVRFGVAVPTLREALRRLEANGMIELRHGSGIYVGPNISRLVLPNPMPGTVSWRQLTDLLEARLQIEPHIVAKAAEVREEAGIAKLRAGIAEAERCIATDDEGLWLVNLELHRNLAAAAGNPVLTEVVESLLLVHSMEQRQILAIYGDKHRDFLEHQQLVDAVVNGDVENARRLAREHLQDVADRVRTSGEVE
ncbi:FadR/GntR family transcriptional regulator [Tenggerimyces flavus]|uniref:FadR/GntR family transcriptional regulator n=1 Tax=Tenggerimyces flavus TaxID=1708749 RepID=A0ABV7YCC2_9ACTN|nr:FadR/GntR family transcriptional regulator [Tenggerimyces flavus]MBM7783646.1 GntR family transcriptional repressor for pyruvate dehydrogenase complex [Tenggerimyces flavus]